MDEWLSVIWIVYTSYILGFQLSVAASNSNNGSNQSLVSNVISTPNQTAPIQPMRCEVCNIECQTKDIYEKHITGKKHRRKLQEKISSSTAIFPESSNAMIYGASCVANAEELERKKQKLLDSGAAVNSVRMCTICNVACNSHEVFVKHLSGRRHAAQVKLISKLGNFLIEFNTKFFRFILYCFELALNFFMLNARSYCLVYFHHIHLHFLVLFFSNWNLFG